MKRHEVIQGVSDITGIPTFDCDAFVDVLQKVITDGLIKDGKVVIRGFMSFEVQQRESYVGYNPITKEREQFTPLKTIRCKVGTPMKDAINEAQKDVTNDAQGETQE